MAIFGRKTILAIAIAAASTHASAYTQDVSGTTRIYVPTGNYEGIVLEGTAERQDDGIDFDAPQVTGDFVSNATFNLTGDFADAIGIDDDSGTPRITGSFKHNGEINIEGYNGLGILLANVEVGQAGVVDDSIGNIENYGTIRVVDTSGRTPVETIAGMSIEQSIIYGDLVNRGVIQVNALNAHGIKVDGTAQNSNDKFALIGRDVINAGTIDVRGANAIGLELIATKLGTNPESIGTDIENTGKIDVTGENSKGLRLDSTDYNRIYNSGSIQARGAGSVGIEIRESFGNTTLQHADSDSATGQKAEYLMQNGIINEGNIWAEGTGIRIVNDLMNTQPGETSNFENFYRITVNSGSVGGRDSAIDGNGQTNLYLNGGQIAGNIEGVRTAFINGKVVILADLIEANLVDVAAGDLFIAEIHTAIDGDMVVRSGANVTAYISDAADQTKGLIRSTGKVTLENGSQLSVYGDRGAFTKESTRYVLVSADQLVNLGAEVKSATPLLAVTGVTFSDTQVTANVGLATGEEASGGLQDIGVNGNALRAARAFIDGVLPSLPTDSALYRAFLNADDAQLRKLTAQIQPEINGGAHVASMSATGLTTSALANRASAVGANSGETFVDTGVWIKALNGNTDQGVRGGIAGFDADSKGLIVGADGKINPSTTLGLAFSHVTTDVASDTGNKTDVSSNTLSVYGAWVDGPQSLVGSLSYGKSANEAKRYVAGEKLSADYDSKTVAADLVAGYDIHLDDKFTVQPVVGTRYTKVDIDSFSETGSAAALRTGSQTIEVFDIGAGLNLSANLGSFKPSARLMAYRDLARDTAETTSAFLLGGNTFVTTGAEATKWTYEAGVGLDWSRDNYTVGASYDYTRKADFNADTFSVKFRWDF